MAMSNVERVLSDCFSKIMARVLCCMSAGLVPFFQAVLSSMALSIRPANSSLLRSDRDRKSRPARLGMRDGFT